MNHLIDPTQTTLLVIDLQQQLLPAIDGSEDVVMNARRLMQCANLLEINTRITEQIPERLGRTAEALSHYYHGPYFEKSAFGAAKDERVIKALGARRDVVILGTETHVCVLQTTMQLLSRGFSVWVVEDACGSRTQTNKQAGLERMQQAGATIVTTEMVVFEWLTDAEHPQFREALALIK